MQFFDCCRNHHHNPSGIGSSSKSAVSVAAAATNRYYYYCTSSSASMSRALSGILTSFMPTSPASLASLASSAAAGVTNPKRLTSDTNNNVSNGSKHILSAPEILEIGIRFFYVFSLSLLVCVVRSIPSPDLNGNKKLRLKTTWNQLKEKKKRWELFKQLFLMHSVLLFNLYISWNVVWRV